MKRVRQFEIWNIDLNPTKGSEQRGLRPCLILQTNAANKVSQTFLVAPLTTKKLDRVFPFELLLRKDSVNKLKNNSKLLLNQIRTIDELRLSKRIGILGEDYFKLLFKSIDTILDREGMFR